MTLFNKDEFQKQSYDCLILVNPEIKILDKQAFEIHEKGGSLLNVGKDLSVFLLNVMSNKRSQQTQKWLSDALKEFETSPVLLHNIDLLFEPSLNLDVFMLLRQICRLKQLIVLWPGEFSVNNLSYSIPQHHHYRTWKLNSSLLQQPKIVINQIGVS